MVAMNLHQTTHTTSASSDSSHQVFWRKLWQLPTPHKVRHFAWKACSNILPTKDNLYLRRVLSENLCEECGNATKSSSHLFWSCPRVQLVWGCLKLPSLLRSGQFHSFFDLLWFLLMIESFDEEKVALVVTIAWSMWSNRNEVRHGGTRKMPEALVQWVMHYLTNTRLQRKPQRSPLRSLMLCGLHHLLPCLRSMWMVPYPNLIAQWE